MLVHGVAAKCQDLAKKIEQNFTGIKVWTPENTSRVQLTFEKRNVIQSGCKAIGQLGSQLEEQYVKFAQQHQAHIQEEPEPQGQSENCSCCSNDLFFNGVILNTEHGFLLADENDTGILQEYGISQEYPPHPLSLGPS